MKPEYWDTARRSLSRRDPVLRSVIRAYRGDALQLRGRGFQTLARAIVGQQISVKAADSIWRRLQLAVRYVSPPRIAGTSLDTLRGCGLSNSKAIYLHSLASHFLQERRKIKSWPRLSDDAIISELVAIKGIGRWTAEMFLIFGLGRPDVFPVDDLGLLKALRRHYNRDQPMDRAAVLAVGESWRPYRSLGTWYLWRALDPLPVVY